MTHCLGCSIAIDSRVWRRTQPQRAIWGVRAVGDLPDTSRACLSLRWALSLLARRKAEERWVSYPSQRARQRSSCWRLAHIGEGDSRSRATHHVAHVREIVRENRCRGIGRHGERKVQSIDSRKLRCSWVESSPASPATFQDKAANTCLSCCSLASACLKPFAMAGGFILHHIVQSRAECEVWCSGRARWVNGPIWQ